MRTALFILVSSHSGHFGRPNPLVLADRDSEIYSIKQSNALLVSI
jgi:hypothetical protein